LRRSGGCTCSWRQKTHCGGLMVWSVNLRNQAPRSFVADRPARVRARRGDGHCGCVRVVGPRFGGKGGGSLFRGDVSRIPASGAAFRVRSWRLLRPAVPPRTCFPSPVPPEDYTLGGRESGGTAVAVGGGCSHLQSSSIVRLRIFVCGFGRDERTLLDASVSPSSGSRAVHAFRAIEFSISALVRPISLEVRKSGEGSV
jgi:hypothetical protein